MDRLSVSTFNLDVGVGRVGGKRAQVLFRCCEQLRNPKIGLDRALNLKQYIVEKCAAA